MQASQMPEKLGTSPKVGLIKFKNKNIKAIGSISEGFWLKNKDTALEMSQWTLICGTLKAKNAKALET